MKTHTHLGSLGETDDGLFLFLGLLFAFVFILVLGLLIGLLVVIFLIRRGIRLRLGLQGLILDPGSPRLERTKIILGRHLAASRGKKQAASVF